MSQAEAAKNYKLCEQVTEEIMNLKGRKRELVYFPKRCLRRKIGNPDTSLDGGISNSPCDSPITSECIGSRINPVNCDSPDTGADSHTITSDSSLKGKCSENFFLLQLSLNV